MKKCFFFGCRHESVYFRFMNTSKEKIKEWLGQSPVRTREWLASKCGVTKRTVDNWLSSGIEIPLKAQRLLEALMRNSEPSAKDEEKLTHLMLTVPLNEFEDWSRAALLKNQIVTHWAIDAIRQAYQSENVLKPSMVAADPAADGGKRRRM